MVLSPSPNTARFATGMQPAPVVTVWAAKLGLAAPVLALVAIGVGAPIYTTPMAEAALTDRLLVTNAVTLVLFVALAVVVVGLLTHVHDRLRPAGQAAAVLALAGTTLAAGGAWDSLFSLPYVAELGPEVVARPTGGTLLLGFLVSYMVFALGWLALAVALTRAGVVSRGAGAVIGLAALLALAPAPTALRILPLCVGVALISWAVMRART